MGFKAIICLIKGHDWVGQGWTSSNFDKTVPPSHVANLWRCYRCHKKARTYESAEQLKERYDRYYNKYGPGYKDHTYIDEEFTPPKPNKTKLRIRINPKKEG